MKPKSILTAILFVLTPVLGLAQSVISVNIAGGNANSPSAGGGGGEGIVTGNAGLGQLGNWNNAIGASNVGAGLTVPALVDSTGAATAATFSWVTNNTWSTSTADGAGGDVDMMSGYIDNFHANGSITVAGLGADGRFTFTGSSDFWNNFAIQFTALGAELFGFTKLVHGVGLHFYLAFSQAANGVQSSTQAGWLAAAGAPVVHTILATANTSDVRVMSEAPFYQLVDQRISVSLHSHLPVPSNKSVVDEKESINRSIAEAFFEAPLFTTLTFSDDGDYESHELRRKTFSGQVAFIKKDARHFIWNKLTTSYELRFFRFHLYIVRREYDVASHTWIIKEERMSIPADKVWSCELRFVSDT